MERERAAGVERAGFVVADWQRALGQVTQAETRTVAVLDELGLAELVSTIDGRTSISRRGRPGLRTAAWRATWAALRANAVYAARYEHLTTRAANPLCDRKARAAIAAASLRQLLVVVTRRVAWDPALAGGKEVAPIAA